MQKSELSVYFQDGTIVVDLPMGFAGGFGPEGFRCCYVKAGLHSPFSQGWSQTDDFLPPHL